MYIFVSIFVKTLILNRIFHHSESSEVVNSPNNNLVFLEVFARLVIILNNIEQFGIFKAKKIIKLLNILLGAFLLIISKFELILTKEIHNFLLRNIPLFNNISFKILNNIFFIILKLFKPLIMKCKNALFFIKKKKKKTILFKNAKIFNLYIFGWIL